MLKIPNSLSSSREEFIWGKPPLASDRMQLAFTMSPGHGASGLWVVGMGLFWAVRWCHSVLFSPVDL